LFTSKNNFSETIKHEWRESPAILDIAIVFGLIGFHAKQTTD
jgi:hypothetical protein